MGVLLLLVVVDTYFDTAGTLQFDQDAELHDSQGYYDSLADAFLSGQLYLKTTPAPQLLALPDPYDPSKNERFRLQDASLYNGRYYLYFGPLPAVIHAVWRILTQQPINAGPVEVASAVAATLCFWWMLARFRRFHAPLAQRWTVVAATLAFGLGGVMLYLVARPAVYHEAILVAIACAFGGWSALFITYASPGSRGRWALLGGALLACAFAARITYLGYALAAGIALLARVLLTRGGTRSAAVRDLALYSAPLVLVGGVLLLYNWARFDSPFEFGSSYQLSGAAQSSTCGSNMGSYFALYFTAIPNLELHYPFVPFATRPSDSWALAFPSQAQLPELTGIAIEPPIISPVLQSPITLLVLLTPALLLGLRKNVASLLLATALLGGFLAGVPLLSCATGLDFRYYGDLTPAATLLGSFLFVKTLDWLHRRRTVLAQPAATVILSLGGLSWLATLVAGVVLGIACWGYTFPTQVDAVRNATEDWLFAMNWATPPLRIDTFPRDLANPDLRYVGLYQDGWLQQSASFRLHQPAEPVYLVLRGWLPDWGGPGLQTGVQVLLDGQQVADRSVAPGDFQVAVLLRPTPGYRRVDLRFSRLQPLPAPDPRQTAAHLNSLGFEPAT